MNGTPLTNPRHERYAQLRASGKSEVDSYVGAGFKANRGNAARLNANESVRARIAAVQGAAAERVEINRAWVVSKLAQNVENSMLVEREGAKVIPAPTYHPTAANRALELLGKNIGMFRDPVEPAENFPPRIPHEIEDRGRYDLARRIAYLLGKAAQAASEQSSPHQTVAADRLISGAEDEQP
jgi:hypothetical protein